LIFTGAIADIRIELFQIHLNLPKASKMVDWRFKMLWKVLLKSNDLTNGSGNCTIEKNIFKGPLN
jgi:redox-sensitive bicupin YhaK (pirin superfamily)